MRKRSLAIVPEKKEEITVAEQMKNIYPIPNKFSYSEGIQLLKKNFWSETSGFEVVWLAVGLSNLTSLFFSFDNPFLILFHACMSLGFFSMGTVGLARVLLRLCKNKKLLKTNTKLRVEIAFAKAVDNFNASLEKAKLLTECADYGLEFEEAEKQEIFEEIINRHARLQEQVLRFHTLSETKKRLERFEEKTTAIVLVETNVAIIGALIAKKTEIEEELTNLLAELEE